jgi:hypothetical protein
MASNTFDRLSEFYTQLTGKAPNLNFNKVRKDLVRLFENKGDTIAEYERIENTEGWRVANGYFNPEFWTALETSRSIGWQMAIAQKWGNDAAIRPQAIAPNAPWDYIMAERSPGLFNMDAQGLKR